MQKAIQISNCASLVVVVTRSMQGHSGSHLVSRTTLLSFLKVINLNLSKV